MRYGRTREPIPEGTIVEVIQCEIVDGKDILVGFRKNSDEGVCMLEEVEILAPDAGQVKDAQ